MFKNVLLVGRFGFGAFALVGLLLALIVHGAALAGIDVEASHPEVWLLHYAVFPTVILTVVAALRIAGPGARFGDVVALIPRLAQIPIVVVFSYAIVNFILVMPATGHGDPVLQGGRFFFNDHGKVREVSAAQFHAQRSLALRGYSGHWLYLYLVSASYLLFATSKRSKIANAR